VAVANRELQYDQLSGDLEDKLDRFTLKTNETAQAASRLTKLDVYGASSAYGYNTNPNEAIQRAQADKQTLIDAYGYED
jgi:hypothetical protein